MKRKGRNRMLRDIPTKDLVEELSKRQGVKVYKAEDCETVYEIKTTNYGIGEETSTTIIRKDRGPAIILEIID